MISRDRWKRLEPIVDAALDLPADQIAAYLDRACVAAPEIRLDAERLLAVLREEREGARFLDAPPTALTTQFLTALDVAAEPTDEFVEGARVGPYRVLRPLGRGGMGVVYLAQDPRLDRLVALKLLPPWLTADEHATRRLAEEAKAASALDHPNIEAVYDIGRMPDGRPYVAMAYYEGETLRDRIRRGALPVSEAVMLAAQLARGLEAAHGRGIVHRDIKPANVVLTPDGVAKIVDFGVAKASAQGITQPGSTPGTVAYMSPEQTRGLATDARTDLWAVGVVLYEMLAGERPFRGEHRDAVFFSIRHDEPWPLERDRPKVPAAVAEVVRRCLAKDVSARYQTASALRADLELLPERLGPRRRSGRGWVAVAIATTAVLATAMGLLLGRPSPAVNPAGASVVAPASRLAVLPLVASSADGEDTYLADGLTEELILSLSTRDALRVTALSSVMPYKDTNRTVAEIGRELGVATVLAGSARRTGERIGLSLQLIDTRSQRPLWAREYEVEMVDVPTVQRDIADQVVAALRLATRTRERPPLTPGGTTNAEAYTEYLKGRHFLSKLDGASFERARDHFERSLDLDPTYARSWSGLSDTYNNLSELALLPASEAYPRARGAAERALELDPELAEAHAALAMALAMYYWDTDRADRHFRQALELDPSSARAHRLYAVHLRNLGRFEEALEAVRKAQELDPLSAFSHIEEGRVLYLARRYDEAIAKYELLLQATPGYTLTKFYLALALAQTREYAASLASLRELDPGGRPDVPALRGYVYALMGQRDEALSMLAMLDARPVSSFQRAVIYVGLGEHARALDLLEQGAEERTWHMRLLGVEPMLDPLRSEPRFQALLRKVNLAG